MPTLSTTSIQSSHQHRMHQPKRSEHFTYRVASSPIMLQSAKILAAACQKPAVPFENCQREYGRVTRSASPQRSRYTGPSSFSPSCTVQRLGFTIGSRSGYWSGLNNAACAPFVPSNWKTTCRTKKSLREPACPAFSPFCFRCSCAGLVMSERWKA